MRKVAAFLAEKPTAEVVELLTEHGVPCGPVMDLDDVVAFVDDIAPGVIVHETHPRLGPMVHPSPAVEFDEPVSIRPAPGFGEHSEEVLRALGSRARTR